AEDGIRDFHVTGVQTCALPISQFLAFSHHTNPKYSNYFDDERTLRRKLFTRIEADLVFLGNYYSEVNKIRDMQNECIEKLINKRWEERRVGKECRSEKDEKTRK